MLDSTDTIEALILGTSAAKQGLTVRELAQWFQQEYRARGFRSWSHGYLFCFVLARATYNATLQAEDETLLHAA